MSTPVAFLHASTNSFTELPGNRQPHTSLGPNSAIHYKIYCTIRNAVKFVLIPFTPTFSSANIVDSHFTGLCMLESFHMSINQISDIYIVPYASAIRCFIICTSNLQSTFIAKIPTTSKIIGKDDLRKLTARCPNIQNIPTLLVRWRWWKWS